MGEEGILLALVEAMHLVDKHEGALLHQSIARGLGALDRRADVLDPAEHGADADELRIERIGHQAPNGGLSHTPRPPPGPPKKGRGGGPPDSNASRSGMPGPSTCCWPTTAPRVCGRSRSANGWCWPGE